MRRLSGGCRPAAMLALVMCASWFGNPAVGGDLASVTVDGWTVAVTKVEVQRFGGLIHSRGNMSVTLELAVDGPKATEANRLVDLASNLRVTDNRDNVVNISGKGMQSPSHGVLTKLQTLAPSRDPMRSLRRMYRLIVNLPDDRSDAIASLAGDLLWVDVKPHVFCFTRADLVAIRHRHLVRSMPMIGKTASAWLTIPSPVFRSLAIALPIEVGTSLALVDV
jgi:hypothetical protein